MSALPSVACKPVPWCYNPILFLDANNPAGNQTQPSNGSALATWVDLSSKNNSVTQATGAAQPIYTTGAINGKPVIAFNGTSHYLSSSTAFAGITSNVTIIFVASFGNVTTQNAAVISSTPDDAASRCDTFGPYMTSYIWDFGNIGANGRLQNTFTESKDTYYSFTYYVKASTEQSIYVNNTVKYTKATTSTFNPSGKTLQICRFAATSDYTLANIAEIIIYPTALTTTQMTTVYDYLKAKYALP